MRIDKFLSNMGIASRTESSKAARQGLILVNGLAVKKAVPVRLLIVQVLELLFSRMAISSLLVVLIRSLIVRVLLLASEC